MIDVDHFKDVNDQFGHQVGDQILQQISDVLRKQIRETDIVGRYGGEEFLVLMPDTGSEGAMLVAEKLRQAISDRITLPKPSLKAAPRHEQPVTLRTALPSTDWEPSLSSLSSNGLRPRDSQSGC